MATIQEKIGEVRENLGETDVSASLFTDDQVTAWVTSTGSINEATLRGWKVKMAHFAGLVNVTDGAASREFSDLFEHAQEMVKFYNTAVTKGPTLGRSRVGKIVRS